MKWYLGFKKKLIMVIRNVLTKMLMSFCVNYSKNLDIRTLLKNITKCQSGTHNNCFNLTPTVQVKQMIANTTNGVILECRKTEIANLCGYFYEGTSGSKMPQIGDEIAVHSMFRRLEALAGMQSRIKDAQTLLREAADDLDLAQPIIERASQ
jgi:hypothetical protein